MRTTTLPILLALLTAPTLLPAQSAGAGQTGRRRLMPRDEEIALARSAAPPAVSDSATVYVLTDAGYQLAAPGNNGVSCIVSRSWVESIEPVCYDEEASATAMRMEIRRMELMHQGVNKDSVDRDIAAGMAAGRFRLPRRPAMSYMMSSAQRLVSDDGRPVGRWQPHLMIYYPFLTERDVGVPAGGNAASVMVTDPGMATSNMIVVVREFVDPRLPGAPTR